MKKLAKKSLAMLATLGVMLASASSPAYAQGNAIEIGNLKQLLWDIVATIQEYSLPLMTIVIAGIGVGILMSGDDTSRKEQLKGWIVKILIGGILVFSAATIANIIKNNVANIG